MDRVEEIEAAINNLPPETRWDQQLDRDSAAGKLDFLFKEAESESARKLLRDWPTLK